MLMLLFNISSVDKGITGRKIAIFSEKTQFILITHNKLTMNSSSLLHGISQEQTGVSKLFSVSIDD